MAQIERNRTPEDGHSRNCLASAIMSAVQNFRDIDMHRGEGDDFESSLDHDFRLAAQANEFLAAADGYLTWAEVDHSGNNVNPVTDDFYRGWDEVIYKTEHLSICKCPPIFVKYGPELDPWG